MPLAVMAAVSVLHGTSIPHMTRDVAAIAGIHPLSGALSSLGILAWWSAAAVWLIAALLHRERKSGKAAAFALAAAILSSYLALDDLFQFHEHLAPVYLRVPEKAVIGALGFAVLGWLAWFRGEIGRAHARLLGLSLALLALSALLDVVLERQMARLGHWSFFLEDGFKWLGICAWLSFCAARFRTDFLVRRDS